jgi:isocitrate dehydrogenase
MIENAMEETIRQKTVTYDFERQMEGATKVGTSKFADLIINNMAAIERGAGGYSI